MDHVFSSTSTKLIEDMSDRRYQNIMVIGVDPVGTIFSEVLQEQKESYV